MINGPGLVDGYRGQPRRAFDEMLAADGLVRPGWQDLSEALDLLGPSGLDLSSATASRLLESDGVVYRSGGAEQAQPWQLDPLPVLLDGEEWSALEPRLAQRARLLDALVSDLYGSRASLKRGLLPPEVVFAHSGFLRAADQLRVPGPHQLFTVATDLARDADGAWVVLHDRAASPSGAGFAMENRRVISRVLPGLYREARINRLGPFFHAMRLGLQEIAPLTAEAPRVVLLTSGPLSETAYDQALLSQLLGYPLVAGSDLSVREGRVWLRGIEGPEPVDVVLRRVDSDFCDPLELRSESQLGVPGLLEACRLGSVSVVNGFGTGILENPGLLPFLPALSQGLLEEELLLPSAQTWWCGDPASLSHVRAHLDHLVLKPIARGISRSSSFGWELSGAEKEELLAQVSAQPNLWVGQSPVAASTVPTVSSSAMTPRSMILRAFSVAQGGAYHVLSGGLVRVAPSTDSLLVSTQSGAVTKDAWVVTHRSKPVFEPWTSEEPPTEMRQSVVSPRMAEDLFWLGRYTERAESTSRLLRTVRDRSGDFTHSSEPAGAECLLLLLEVLTTVTATWPGFIGEPGAERRAAPQRELLALILDDARPGTLAHSLRRLTSATHAVRDQLSSDTWVVLGNLDTALRELARSGGNDVLIGQTLTRALGGLLALAGLAAESMVRDLGWHFMEIGRRIERAQQVVALLRASLLEERAPDVEALVLESVLVAAESIITYRRRFAPRPEVGSILELLLLDRGNPRSVGNQLDRLAGHLSQMPRSENLLASVEELVATVRTTQVGTLTSEVEGGRRLALGSFLADLEASLRRLGKTVELTYFEDLVAPRALIEAIA